MILLEWKVNIYLDLTLDGLLSLHHLKWDNALEAPLFSTCVTEITMRMKTSESKVSLAILWEDDATIPTPFFED